MRTLPEYILDRVFEAPREIVWRAWTDPALLPRWYGPNVETIVHKFDLKPGGMWLGEMKLGDTSSFSKAIFEHIVPNEKLVWYHSASDSDWNIIASPMMEGWPRVLLTTVRFEEVGATTKVRLTWVPFEATEAEIACFAKSMASMDKGWAKGYELLDELFLELQSAS